LWQALKALPVDLQTVVHQNFAQLKTDVSRQQLHVKTVGSGKFHSVHVGLYYRALSLPVPDGVHWFWIGSHSECNKIIG